MLAESYANQFAESHQISHYDLGYLVAQLLDMHSGYFPDHKTGSHHGYWLPLIAESKKSTRLASAVRALVVEGFDDSAGILVRAFLETLEVLSLVCFDAEIASKYVAHSKHRKAMPSGMR